MYVLVTARGDSHGCGISPIIVYFNVPSFTLPVIVLLVAGLLFGFVIVMVGAVLSFIR